MQPAPSPDHAAAFRIVRGGDPERRRTHPNFTQPAQKLAHSVTNSHRTDDNQVARGVPTVMATGGWLLTKWASHMRARDFSRKTIDERVRLVLQFEAETGVLSLDATWENIADWLGQFHGGTLQTYHSNLRCWWQWLARMDYRLDDPTLKLPTPRAPKRYPHPVSVSELGRILATQHRRKTHAMILLMAYQGLRDFEVAKIRGDDFGEELFVHGKGGREDYLPIHPLVAEVAATMPARGPWFPTPGNPNRPMTSKAVSSTVSKLMRRAAVNNVPHGLRHFFGTELLRVYGNLEIVRQLMRHASVATTQIYTATDRAELHRTIQGLPVPLYLVPGAKTTDAPGKLDDAGCRLSSVGRATDF